MRFTSDKNTKDNLSGKTVLFVGGQDYTDEYKAVLEKQGVRIEYADPGASFLTLEGAIHIPKKTEKMTPRPDAVVVFNPGINTLPQTFGHTMILANGLRRQGIGMLLLEDMQESLSHEQALQMQDRGVMYRPYKDVLPEELPPLIQQLVHQQDKPPRLLGA